ncbi:DUF2878 domain-containing protein [Porticoccaceae bacterium LTM1]|nr:DUF2878 domain-containing protein [Porticoccaceae bacterium LTM1]
MKNLVNLLIFQTGWLASVVGAANGYPWLSLLAVALLVPLHCAVVGRACKIDFQLMAALLIVGLCWDSFLQASGLVRFHQGFWLGNAAPCWILALWILFSLTLNHSLGWLRKRLWLGLLFGAVGGPLSYFAGEKLGALSLNENYSLLVIALGWALITPLCCWLARIFHRRLQFSELAEGNGV